MKILFDQSGNPLAPVAIKNDVSHHMTSDDEAEILALMRAARAKARGYADL